jgi:lactoylglutathione lyase
MELAKNHIDVGLYTRRPGLMLTFWQGEMGLPYEELLKVGSGVHQHRHGMNGSVLKINATREALGKSRQSGYRFLSIARQGIEGGTYTWIDPDQNLVTLVPPGHEGIEGIALGLEVRDEAAFDDFYGRVMQLEQARPHAYRCGDSLLWFRKRRTARRCGDLPGKGYRYITVQVRDVDREHAGLLARGAEEGRPPVTLGTTARISFVRDPDGNWIEISQRASLTGPLPG